MAVHDGERLEPDATRPPGSPPRTQAWHQWRAATSSPLIPSSAGPSSPHACVTTCAQRYVLRSPESWLTDIVWPDRPRISARTVFPNRRLLSIYRPAGN